MSHKSYQGYEMGEEIDFRLIGRNIRRNRWPLLLFMLLTVIAALVYKQNRPLNYQASLLLQVQQNNLASSSLERVPLDEATVVQTTLIRSPYILEPVIKSLSLDTEISTHFNWHDLFSNQHPTIHVEELNIPQNFSNMPLYIVITNHQDFQLLDSNHHVLDAEKFIKIDKITAPVGTEFIINKKPISKITALLRTKLIVNDLTSSSSNITNKIGILQLNYSSYDPDETVRTLNEIAKITQQKSLDWNLAETNKKLIFIKSQLPSAELALRTANEKLDLYKSTSHNTDPSIKKEQLSTRISEIEKRIQTLQVTRANLLQQYTERYPFVVSINAKISTLNNDKKILYRQLEQVPDNNNAINTIMRDIEVKNKLYISLLNQINELELAKAGITSDVEVLVKATTADSPTTPSSILIVFMAAIVGLIIGSTTIVITTMISGEQPHFDWIAIKSMVGRRNRKKKARFAFSVPQSIPQ